MLVKSKAKHPVKVHLWEGVSWPSESPWKGATKVAIFPGKTRMDSQLFCRIVQEYLVPFVEKKFPDKNYVFQQDNDPKHVSHYSREKFEEYGVTTVSWPSESPGLNVIECLWHELKDYLRNEKKTGG